MLLTLAGAAEARLTSPILRRASYPNGVATFNDFSSQGTTTCGQKAGQPGTYGAAASDVSPNISGGKCSGSIDISNCNGQSPINAMGPSCPTTNCGKCYNVTNQGAIPVNDIVGGIGNSVIVQIIDSCPQSNPQNYCKTDVPANQRCEDPNTNQLDIESSAYEALTGTASPGPNLQILIEDSDCSGGSSIGSAAQSSAPTSSSPPSPPSPAAPSSSPPPPLIPPFPAGTSANLASGAGSGTDGSQDGQPGGAASSYSIPAATSTSSTVQFSIIPGLTQSFDGDNQCDDGDDIGTS